MLVVKQWRQQLPWSNTASQSRSSNYVSVFTVLAESPLVAEGTPWEIEFNKYLINCYVCFLITSEGNNNLPHCYMPGDLFLCWTVCELPDLDFSWSCGHFSPSFSSLQIAASFFKNLRTVGRTHNMSSKHHIANFNSIVFFYYLYCHLRGRNTLNIGTALSPWSRLHKRVFCHCFICQQTDHLIKTDRKVTVRFFWGGSRPNKMISLMMIINVIS